MRKLKFDIVSKQLDSDELHHDVMILEEIEQAWPDYLDYEVVARREFTGAVDKNGNEIFFGDVLALADQHFVVDFGQWDNRQAYEDHESGFGIYARGLNNYPDSSLRDSEDWFVVIGNIYDNPELAV